MKGSFITKVFSIISSLVSSAFLLTGCTTQNTSSQLLNKVTHELHKNYNIPHGDLVAAYDLLNHRQSACLYSPDFYEIINNDDYHRRFLNKFKNKFKNIKHLDIEAKTKTAKLKNLVTKLNSKYKFLTPLEISIINQNHANFSPFSLHPNIDQLAKMDKIAHRIPLMLPERRAHITSSYGIRKHPISGKRKMHTGIDLKDGKLSPVYSSAIGKVELVARMKGYGNTVDIRHYGKFKTRYAHLDKVIVKEGQRVIRGQKIGVQGNSGNSTSHHLHFEIWLNNKHINPLEFITHACNCQ